jgi:hypothetical protein
MGLRVSVRENYSEYTAVVVNYRGIWSLADQAKQIARSFDLSSTLNKQWYGLELIHIDQPLVGQFE